MKNKKVIVCIVVSLLGLPVLSLEHYVLPSFSYSFNNVALSRTTDFTTRNKSGIDISSFKLDLDYGFFIFDNVKLGQVYFKLYVGAKIFYHNFGLDLKSVNKADYPEGTGDMSIIPLALKAGPLLGFKDFILYTSDRLFAFPLYKSIEGDCKEIWDEELMLGYKLGKNCLGLKAGFSGFTFENDSGADIQYISKYVGIFYGYNLF